LKFEDSSYKSIPANIFLTENIGRQRKDVYWTGDNGALFMRYGIEGAYQSGHRTICFAV
jgi:hypothetical protein